MYQTEIVTVCFYCSMMCRTGFATPSAMFCISTKAKVSDGVANPVRQMYMGHKA